MKSLKIYLATIIISFSFVACAVPPGPGHRPPEKGVHPKSLPPGPDKRMPGDGPARPLPPGPGR